MRTNKKGLKKQVNNLTKLIRMKCLECTCYQPKEIRLCEIRLCPLWKNRPVKSRGLYTLIKQMKKKETAFSEAEK